MHIYGNQDYQLIKEKMEIEKTFQKSPAIFSPPLFNLVIT